MVVEEIKDFDACAVGEEDVGDVGLPAFVGQCCFEADVGAFRLLFRFWGDEPLFGQDATNR